MSWFTVPVLFSVEAPTHEAAGLLVEDQHAAELSELLDYPQLSVSVLERDVDEDGDHPLLDRYLVTVSLIVEAQDERQAASRVERAVHGLGAATHDFREVREPTPASDPRLLAEETKRAISDARDWLTDHLRMDAEALRRGVKFSELIILHDVLPACFAAHYTPELVEQVIKTVERVAEKLSSYPSTYLASTAEELAAHALIDEARSQLEVSQDLDTERFSEAQAAVADRELEDLHQDAFEDHDVLMLFDARYDGLETSAVADQLGMANLHPSDWFKAFRPGQV